MKMTFAFVFTVAAWTVPAVSPVSASAPLCCKAEA